MVLRGGPTQNRIDAGSDMIPESRAAQAARRAWLHDVSEVEYLFASAVYSSPTGPLVSAREVLLINPSFNRYAD